jgi:cytidylate kinase
MKHHSTVTQYFKEAVAPREKWPFVTISREVGAGGHALAEALCSRLSRESGELSSGWRVLDRALCEKVAAEPELKVSLDSLLKEEFYTGLDDYFRSTFSDRSPQRKVDHAMFRTVRRYCAEGKAIVIGRAGAFVTRDMPLGVHIRLVADRRTRIRNLSRETGLDAAAARKIMDQKDAKRARLIETYFKKDIADPLMYDCAWNTGKISFEAIAESVLDMIRQRVRAAAPAS